MKLPYAFAAICLFLSLSVGPARAATINAFDRDDRHASRSDDGAGKDNDFDKKDHDKGDNGHSNRDFSHSSGFSWNGDNQKSDDDRDNGKDGWRAPPPWEGVANFGDGWTHHDDHETHHDRDRKWDRDDRDEYRRYYAKICDRRWDEGDKHRHSRDPSCDPVPLPGALPMFGAGLALLTFGRLRRARLDGAGLKQL